MSSLPSPAGALSAPPVAPAAMSTASLSSPAPSTASAEGVATITNEEMPAGSTEVRGHDFNATAADGGVDWRALLASYATMGFQATALAAASAEVRAMLAWRLSSEALRASDSGRWADAAVRAQTRCTTWLAFTSNQISSGQRDVIRWLVQHRMVSVLVTTAGAVEEDAMKCLRPHYIGDYTLEGRALRLRGINRLGNLLVPNLNYVALEEWFKPLLQAAHEEQGGGGAGPSGGGSAVPLRRVWTPSALIARMGAALSDERSVLYWAARNGVPVFCPGLTDGAIGDMIFFHGWEREGFILDVAADVRRINKIAMRARHSGMVILGGGTAKHHTCNANLMRNGADHAVFINTGVEFDGSDSGARPDEAVSWGKIRLGATPAKVHADASLVFPLLAATTWVEARARAVEAAAAGDADAAFLLREGFAEPAEDADDAARWRAGTLM